MTSSPARTAKVLPGKPNRRYSDAFLFSLAGMACDRLDDLLDDLGVNLRPSGKRYVGRCPVHGGKSPLGLNLYPDGFEARGNWQCLSDKCHKKFSGSLVGFVWGVLSHEKCGWQGEGDRRVPFAAAVAYLLDFLGLEEDDVKVDASRQAAVKLARDVALLNGKPPPVRKALCTRRQWREMVRVPAPVYLARGFRPETLETFEVGEVVEPRSDHFGRTAYPVYDASGGEIVGGVSRSPHPRCEACRLCHAPGGPPCPPGQHRWRVIGDFKDKQHVYNLARATPVVKETRCVVVVEGAGDVWRLHEAGLTNVVGLFGSEPGDAQYQALESLMPRHLVVLTDDDDAGHAAAEALADRCWFSNVSRLLPVEAGEVGDMSVEDIRRHIVPEVERRMRRK